MTDLSAVVLENTQQAILAMRNGSSWRRLSAAVGVPHSVLHAIGTGRWEHVAWDTVRQVRVKIGLPDPGDFVITLPCPSCGQAHGDGLDCHNRPVAAVAVLAPGECVAPAGARVVQPAAGARPRKHYKRPCLSDDPRKRLEQLRRLVAATEAEIGE